MFGKKLLWFVGSTFVSFLVFSSIAWTIQPLVTKLTDQRLKACEGQSVLVEDDQSYLDATIPSLATIQGEERRWQARGITHYCIEVRKSGSRMDEITFVLVVRDGELDTNVSSCHSERFAEMCRQMFDAIQQGLEYPITPITVASLFNIAYTLANATNHVIRVTFDPIYHFPRVVTIEYPFDDEVLLEVTAFVPLD